MYYLCANRGIILLMKVMEIPIVVSFEEDTYIANCPIIQGAFAQGDTPEEAVKELIDVVKMIKEYKNERGEDIVSEMITETDKVVTTIPIAI